MKREGELVNPGDYIALIEEFIPGVNTYVDESIIRAEVAGFIKINWKDRVISVTPIKTPITIDVGDEVIGKIFHISGVFGYVEIRLIKKKADDGWILLDSKYTGVLYPHIKVNNDVGFIYRIRDEILAYVESKRNRTIHLSIRGERYGVIRAFCRQCRSELTITKNNKGRVMLRCPICKNEESRKLSRFYGRANVLRLIHQEKLLNRGI